jgi:hypothetical protein
MGGGLAGGGGRDALGNNQERMVRRWSEYGVSGRGLIKISKCTRGLTNFISTGIFRAASPQPTCNKKI